MLGPADGPRARGRGGDAGHRHAHPRGGGARSAATASTSSTASAPARRSRTSRGAVAAHDPDHVGISATTISITNAGAHRRAREGARAARVVTVGGPHVSAVPERTLDAFPGFDYGDRRRGRALVSRPDRRGSTRGDDPRGVAGLVHRDGDGVRANPRAPYLDGEELDRLPPPAWDLLPDFPLRFQPNVFNYRAHAGREPRHVARLPVLLHVLRPLHLRPARTLPRRRLRRCASAGGSPTLGVRHILFYDDLFTVNQPARRRALRALPRTRASASRWSCNSHPNLLDLETLRAHAARGLLADRLRHRVGLAARARRREARGELPRMLETLRLTRAAGIRVKGLLMMAHPTEDEDEPARDGRVPAPRAARPGADDEVHAVPGHAVVRARSASTARSTRTGSA